MDFIWFSQPTSLTPTIYAVLQMISRGRDEGTTAVRISKEMGIDPKSVFHYIKVPQQLGIMCVPLVPGLLKEH